MTRKGPATTWRLSGRFKEGPRLACSDHSTTPVVADTDVVSFLFKVISLLLRSSHFLPQVAGRFADHAGRTRVRHGGVVPGAGLFYPCAAFWTLYAAATGRRNRPRVGADQVRLLQGGNPFICDAWIAAAGVQLNIPLVTHNARDYAAVENLVLLHGRDDPRQVVARLRRTAGRYAVCNKRGDCGTMDQGRQAGDEDDATDPPDRFRSNEVRLVAERDRLQFGQPVAAALALPKKIVELVADGFEQAGETGWWSVAARTVPLAAAGGEPSDAAGDSGSMVRRIDALPVPAG